MIVKKIKKIITLKKHKNHISNNVQIKIRDKLIEGCPT